MPEDSHLSPGLYNRAQEAANYSSAEEFATDLALGLTHELSKMRLNNTTDGGIGIHFTAYEWINGYWIPELKPSTPFLDCRRTKNTGNPSTDSKCAHFFTPAKSWVTTTAIRYSTILPIW